MSAYQRWMTYSQLTACTPGSAPGTKPGIKYVKPFSLFHKYVGPSYCWAEMYAAIDEYTNGTGRQTDRHQTVTLCSPLDSASVIHICISSSRPRCNTGSNKI